MAPSGVLLAVLLPAVVVGQQWFPTLEAIASGAIPPPKGMEGQAVGVFAALDSPDRVKGSIYTRSDISGAKGRVETAGDWGARARPEPSLPVQEEPAPQTHLHSRSPPKRQPGSGRVSVESVDAGAMREQVAEARQQLALNPHDPNLHAYLATQLQLLDLKSHSGGRLTREAKFHYEKALELGFNSDMETIYLNLGLLYQWTGDLTNAVTTLNRLLALPITPDRQAEALNHRADAYQNQGKFSEAVRDHRAAIAVAPTDPTAWASLVQVLKDHPETEGIPVDWKATVQAMTSALAQLDGSSGVGHVKLHFALFTANDKLKDVDSAWQHLLAANAIEFRRQVTDLNYYQSKAMSAAQLDQYITAFRPGAWPSGIGHSSAMPVFVVGMMRSGSTLLEQILASHSQVYGAGEDSVFGSLVDTIIGRIGAAVQSGSMQAFAEAVNQGANEVLSGMRGRIPVDSSSKVQKIIDKQLFNYKHLGLIHMLFPAAPIIHTTRNFMDVVFSIFKYNFNEGGLGWSFNLDELVEYYVAYMKIMNHWTTSLPYGRIFEFRYEELVANQEGITRRLLDYLGLPWEDSVLRFYATDRFVNTMSATQVRRPISSKAVGAWRRYDKFFTPVLEALDRKLHLEEVLGKPWDVDGLATGSLQSESSRVQVGAEGSGVGSTIGGS